MICCRILVLPPDPEQFLAGVTTEVASAPTTKAFKALAATLCLLAVLAEEDPFEVDMDTILVPSFILERVELACEAAASKTTDALCEASVELLLEEMLDLLFFFWDFSYDFSHSMLRRC